MFQCLKYIDEQIRCKKLSMYGNPLNIIVIIAILIGYIQNTYAFDGESSADRASTFIVGKTLLPKQVPHLNNIESYIIGNGFICSSGTGNSQWDFIAGPDYTCPNHIKNEKLSILIDGVEHPFNFEMFRARETGLFYGSAHIGNLLITLIDYAVPNMSIVSRLVFVHNNSIKNHSVQLKAELEPFVFSGISDTIIKTKNRATSGALFQVDTTRFCMFGHDSKWVKNWANRYLVTSWSGEKSVTQKNSGVYSILSETKNIKVNKKISFNLCHYAQYTVKSEQNCLMDILSRDGVSDAEQSILEWQRWFRNVPKNFRLETITDQRARDIVEGGLYIIKSNQAKDGGIVANEKRYNLSWTRDAYCGLRGLLACGHTDESKQFITFMNEVYNAYGFIPNAVSCGSHTYAFYNGNHKNNRNRHLGQYSPCPESNIAPETPALLILSARDYYQSTKDFKTIVGANVSLKYAMDIQLKHAINNKYKLEFSGDETELCGAVSTKAAGFDEDLSKFWSMSSIALCIASLEFYIEYLNLKNENTIQYKNTLTGDILNLNEELDKLKIAFEDDFWRTDMNDHPKGFYDWSKIKASNDFPNGRIVNFSLFPMYYKMKSNFLDRLIANVITTKSYFSTSKTLPLVPDVGDKRYLGHGLGYLLWNLIEINDSLKDIVYHAIINGNSVQCWGSYNEAYDADGKPNKNNLRTFETGVNIDAIAKYWDLGKKSK